MPIMRLTNRSDSLHLHSSPMNLPVTRERLIVPWRRYAAARVSSRVIRNLPGLCQSLHSYAKRFDETGHDDEGSGDESSGDEGYEKEG